MGHVPVRSKSDVSSFMMTSIPLRSLFTLDQLLRFTLNYKKLPFEIVHVPVHELLATAKSAGAPPTSKYPDGSPRYTVPFIRDSHTGKTISDSFLIAEYLDEAYPDTPKVIPTGTRVLQKVFDETVTPKLGPLVPLYIPIMLDYSSEVVLETLKKRFGAFPPPLTDEQRAENWKKAEVSFNALEPVYGTTGGVFVTGDKPVWADFALAGVLASVKIAFGEESEEWKRTSKWIGERVGKVVDEAMGYERASE
ncbi:hypothetical protein V5O48_012784 [Marasmius crinis-equi]|uniref:GST N-terminal domain-containing protein n=1 Tax=Marasmius crinis-equi TaxID=585013 RepID=A0ABR3F247_9AGAR